MGGGNSTLEHTIRREVFIGDGQSEPTDQDYQQATLAWTIVKEIDHINQAGTSVSSHHHTSSGSSSSSSISSSSPLEQKKSILINFYDSFYLLLKEANPDSKISNESMKRKISFLVDVVKILLMGNTNQYEFSKHIKHFVRKYKDENVTPEECKKYCCTLRYL